MGLHRRYDTAYLSGKEEKWKRRKETFFNEIITLKRNKMKNLKWNEFLSDCKEAWETEGMNCSNEVKQVHGFLIACDKRGTNSKIEVAAKAYELMKTGKNMQPN